MKFSALLSLTCAALATARSIRLGRRQDFLKQNGEDAIALNQKFTTLTPDSPCNDGDNACVQGSFAKCDHGKFALSPCGTDEVCAALPLVLSPGTSVTCTTADQRDARIAATGATPPSNSTTSASQSASLSASITASITSSSLVPLPSASASSNNTGGATGNSTVPIGSGNGTSPDSGDPQTSFTLSPQVIAQNFNQDGQSQAEPGQTPSLTSSNNFINFCLTVPDLPITNGQQITGGSCNPAPMGIIAGTANMPSSKFAFPTNGAVLPANTTFTVRLAVQHLATGFFANPDTNFLAAPQTVDASGDIRGHSHVVVEALDGGLAQTTPTDPTRFAFFKGLNEPAQAGMLTADIPNGLPAGAYRIASITTAANHQPVLVAVAQHGVMDDMVYFTVQDGADNTTASAPASIAGSATTLPAASSTVISTASLGIPTSSASLGVSPSASSTASVI